MDLRWPNQFHPVPLRKALKLRGGREDSSKLEKQTTQHTAPPLWAEFAGGLPPPFGDPTGE